MTDRSDYHKRYYQQNKERIAKYYQERNQRPEIKTKNSLYRQQNKKERNEAGKRYYQRHKTEILSYHHEHYQKPEVKVRHDAQSIQWQKRNRNRVLELKRLRSKTPKAKAARHAYRSTERFKASRRLGDRRRRERNPEGAKAKKRQSYLKHQPQNIAYSRTYRSRPEYSTLTQQPKFKELARGRNQRYLQRHPERVGEIRKKATKRYLSKPGNIELKNRGTRRWKTHHPVEVRKQNKAARMRKWEMDGTEPIGPFDPVELRRKRLEQTLREARER